MSTFSWPDRGLQDAPVAGALSMLNLEHELAQQRELTEASVLSQFAPRTLSWLALLPEWTTDLAANLGLTDERELADLLDRLTDADLIERRETLGVGGRRLEAFWVRAAARSRLAQHLTNTRAGQLSQDLADLAAAVRERGVGGPTLEAWSAVVSTYLPDPTGQALLEWVDARIASGEHGEAARLVATARALGEILGGPLADAARRAQWRIDRLQRATEDAHHLRYYFRRQSVEAALDDLLDARSDTWALHLLGDGGVGKTMIVRYLASGRYASDRGRTPFAVARADFDHLDPRYPQQRPGELLFALAAELVGFGGTRRFSYSYRAFLDAADALHEDLARVTADPFRQRELLRELVQSFTTMLTELPSPVVLVLDTCEELAKLYGLGASAPAIDQTFQILELLHEAHDGVRVILAGRRWLVPAPDKRSHTGGPLLSPRPYLRVLRVAGFTPAEARGYLDERQRMRTDGAALTPALRSALLERSVEHEGVYDGRVRDGRGHGGGDRHNPFELASYCEWAFSEPDLDPHELLTAPGDPYVERRIIGKLASRAGRDGLAVAAELGRFDIELAAPGWRRIGVDPTAAFEGLAAQEWLQVLSLDIAGRPRVIEVDEHLRDRIRRVTAAQPTRYPLDRQHLGRDAADVIRRSTIGDLPSETVEAAVRLLPAVEAADLWRYIDEAVLTQRAWGWAAQVAARVGAVEIPRAEANEPSILADILATQAAARIHTSPGPGLAELWRDVARAAVLHPDEQRRTVLAARSALGRIAAGDTATEFEQIPAAALGAVPQGSIAAALEGAFLAGPVMRGLPSEIADPLIAAVETSPGNEAVLAVVMLVDAVRAVHDNADPFAAAASGRAIALATRAPNGGRGWADWMPARGLLDRCRFVRLFVALRRGEARTALPWEQWREEALTRLDDVDAERLVALTVQFDLAHRRLAAAEIDELANADRYVPERQPSIWPHRLVRPLAAELAEAWSIAGDPDRARALLDTRRQEAVDAGTDPDTIEACDLVALGMCRRYRTTRFFPTVRSLARRGSVVVRAEAWLVLTLVHGERPASPDEAGSQHGWWRCQDVQSLVDVNLTLSRSDVVRRLNAPADRIAESRLFTLIEPDPAILPWPMELEERALEMPIGTSPPGAVGRALLAAGSSAGLRSPASWVPRLRHAAARLLDAGDPSGAGQALLLAALAAARSGSEPDAREAWAAYRELGEARWLHNKVTRDGWAKRIDAVQAYLDDRSPAPDPSPELAVRPAPLTTTAADPTDAVAEGSLPYADQPDTAARTAPRTTGGTHRWLIATAGALASIVVGVAVWASFGAMLGQPSADTPSSLAWLGWTTLALVGAALATTVAMHAVSSWRRGYLLRVARRVKILRGPDAVDAEIRIKVETHDGIADLDGTGLTRLGAYITRALANPFHPTGQWSRAIDTSDAAELLEAELRLPKPRWRRSLTVLELDIASDTEAEPWEDIVRGGVPDAPPRRVVTYRRSTGGSTPPDAGSQNFGAAAGPPVYRGPLALRPTTLTRRRMACLVGTPVRTAAGWRLRVQDAAGASAKVQSRGAEVGETLLAIEQLSPVEILVLAPEPVDSPPRPLEGLLPGFVGLSRDALDHGARAVLVLPPMPDRLTAKALELVVRQTAARGRRTRPSALVVLIAQLERLAGTELRPLLFLVTPASHVRGTK